MALFAAAALAALTMGLVSGGHCLAMCAAPCAALTADAEGESGGSLAPVVAVVNFLPKRPSLLRLTYFHCGRLSGYAALGGLSAFAMEGLAWVNRSSPIFQSVWTLMHLIMVAWGLAMLLQLQPPGWLERTGQKLWRSMAPGRHRVGLLGVGALWALMPCGLLYSALLVAALSGGASHGAMSMLFFGMGSAVWLVGGAWAWSRWKAWLSLSRRKYGIRLAGGLLCAMAGWALWMDLVYKPSLWCR